MQITPESGSVFGANQQKNVFVEALWTPIWGGNYNVTKDRDFFALAVGATF
jgi:hypothetical protein